MSDPLTQIVGLLQPSAWYSKVVEGAAAWRVRRSEDGRPFYCAILAGECRLQVRGQQSITLASGDFVLIPSVFDFTMSSIAPMPSERRDSVPIELAPGLVRLGSQDGPPDVRVLLGYCTFGSPDATLLVSLLPRLIHVRGDERLTTLVQLVNQESRANRLGREVILARLVEVLLIEALRSTSSAEAPAGLLRGLADERLAVALRQMHDRPTWPWTVPELAKEAALSRSSFFERFRRAVGVAPMEYLLHWRMALAKDFLHRNVGGVAEIAQRIGYSSASTFSVAFARHVGLPPTTYAREQAACAPEARWSPGRTEGRAGHLRSSTERRPTGQPEASGIVLLKVAEPVLVPDSRSMARALPAVAISAQIWRRSFTELARHGRNHRGRRLRRIVKEGT